MKQFPIEELFKSPVYTNPKISYNGKLISYIKNHGDQVNIVIRDLNSGTEKTAYTSRSPIRETFWLYNEDMIITHDNSGDERFSLLYLDTSTLRCGSIDSLRTKDVQVLSYNLNFEDKIFLSVTEEGKEYPDVYSLDIQTYRIELVKKIQALSATGSLTITEALGEDI